VWVLRASDAEAPVFRMRPGAVKTIGRARGADFVLDIPLVSRVHCRLTADDDGIDVEDLKSTNGTFVNGTRLSPRARLRPGDRLRVGRMEMVVDREVRREKGEGRREK